MKRIVASTTCCLMLLAVSGCWFSPEFSPTEQTYATAVHEYFDLAAPDIKRRIKNDPTATGAYGRAQLDAVDNIWYTSWKRYQEVVVGAKPPYTSREDWIAPDTIVPAVDTPAPVPAPKPAP